MFFFFYLSWIFLQCDRQTGGLGSGYDRQLRWAPLSLLFLTCFIPVVCQGPWANLHRRDYVSCEASAPGEASPIIPLSTVFGFGFGFFAFWTFIFMGFKISFSTFMRNLLNFGWEMQWFYANDFLKWLLMYLGFCCCLFVWNLFQSFMK